MATTQPADQALKLERIEIKRIEVPIEGVTPIRGELATFDSLGEALTLVDDALAIMRGDVK